MKRTPEELADQVTAAKLNLNAAIREAIMGGLRIQATVYAHREGLMRRTVIRPIVHIEISEAGDPKNGPGRRVLEEQLEHEARVIEENDSPLT